MKHELPKLEYGFDALEPFIDAKTMEIHYTKHHQTYIDNLNKALEKYPDLQNKEVSELLKDFSSIPIDIQNAVRNHAGGHHNHTLFWQLLKKDVKMPSELNDIITNDLGGIDKLKEQFNACAMGRFGSGWAWIVLNKGKLEIVNTPNQDSPLMEGKKPILGLDVWEHAYYLKYQNKRADYVNAFWNIINWEEVYKLYKENQNK